jgi:hypothetical protein
MVTFTPRTGIAAFVVLASIVPFARGQCPEWKPGFGAPGINYLEYVGNVQASIVFDYGTGPGLYLGGLFTSAGGLSTYSLVRWNGTDWSAVGGGLAGSNGDAVGAFAIFDDGTGPALYVAGGFDHAGGVPENSIAKWNGSAWSGLGSGIVQGGVTALAVFDDGTGPALYAAGNFYSAGGLPARSFAKWNGSAWSVPAMIEGTVSALAVYDDGSGPALYLGGQFATAGGVATSGLARWDGTTWSDVGGGTDQPVFAMTKFDDGRGEALYVGGKFTQAGGIPANAIARWDGAQFEALGGGIPGVPYNASVQSLLVHDDGTGAALYAGGRFGEATGAPGNCLARWDGSAWSALGSGLTATSDQFVASVSTLCAFDSGAGTTLYAGGHFEMAGDERARGIGAWNAGAWSGLPDGTANGMSGTVEAMAVGDLGNGPRLFAAGAFDFAGQTSVQSVAAWDGSSWSALGPGLDPDEIRALAVYDDGTGPQLYVGGHDLPLDGNPSGHIVRWNGTTWSTLQNGVSGAKSLTEVFALTVFDDGHGPALYVGGNFSGNIARWNGTSWSSVGYGLASMVYALTVYDDGSGAKLVAGGFVQNYPNVFVWDGSTWARLGSGVDGTVYSFAVIEGAGRHDLYAAGLLPSAGGSPLNNVARWDGTSWSSVGRGLCDVVEALGVYDDGTGPALYAGGRFICSGTQSLGHIAKWDGTAWRGLASGVDLEVQSLGVYSSTSGAGASLFAGGVFGMAGSVSSMNIAEWKGCATAPGIPFCAGDGSTASCPCSNSGSPGHGCQNSAGTGGALLASSGTTTPDTVVLTSTGELPQALTIFVQGRNSTSPHAYGDGILCIGGGLKRLYSKNASGGAVSAPTGSEPSITTRSASLGDALYPGFSRNYQAYYRDPNPNFCPAPQGSTFNASNAVSITWD